MIMILGFIIVFVFQAIFQERFFKEGYITLRQIKMVTQQQNYRFYLNPRTADLRQISSELSKFAQDYISTILIPNLSRGGIVRGLGIVEGEEGLLAVIRGEDNTIESIEDCPRPVLRYDPNVYRVVDHKGLLSQTPEDEVHAPNEAVYGSTLDPFLIDWSYSFFQLEPNFTDEGIRKMLQNALAMQKFLQRVSEN